VHTSCRETLIFEKMKRSFQQQVTNYNALSAFDHELLWDIRMYLKSNNVHIQIVLEGAESLSHILKCGDASLESRSLYSIITPLSLDSLLSRTSQEVRLQAKKWLDRPATTANSEWKELIIGSLSNTEFSPNFTLSLTVWNCKTYSLKVIAKVEFWQDKWLDIPESAKQPKPTPFSGNFSETYMYLQSQGVSMDVLPEPNELESQKFWLERWYAKCCESTGAIVTLCTSYGLKRMAEKWISSQGLPTVYISDDTVKMFLVWKGHNFKVLDNDKKNVFANIRVSENLSAAVPLL